MQLRTKWTLALLLTGSLPLALFTYTTTRIQKRGLETAERQLEVAVIDHVATVVERSLDDTAESTHRVGRVLTEGSINSDDARLELAREAMARAEALAQVAVYDDKGKLLDAINRAAITTAAPPQQLPITKPEPNAKGTWQPAVYGPSGPVLRFLEPVFRDGELRAWVLGTLRSDALGEQLHGISRDRFDGRPDGVLLLDENGKIFGGGDETLSPGSSMLRRDLFANVNLPEGAFGKPFAMSTEFKAQSGEEMIGSARSLPTRRWAIVVRRPTHAVYAALASARQLLGIAAAVFTVVAVLLGALLAARTTRPIRRLVDLSRAYGRRELSARSDVRTGDELEDLGASMEQMADGIAAGDKEILRRTAVEADLSRYLPAEVAKSIAAGEKKIALGGERRAITVLFADVVSFTPFAESADPERVVAFLNEHFTVLTEVVFRHGGIVDKFIGDSVMAIFGAPNEQTDHAERALAAAEDMHRFVEASAPAWKESYGFEVKLAIGLSSGEAVVGNLGSETRMEYTAIGDVVNVAARLEALARPGQTLVTEATTAAAGDAFSFSSLGEQPLRGKRAPVKVSEVV